MHQLSWTFILGMYRCEVLIPSGYFIILIQGCISITSQNPIIEVASDIQHPWFATTKHNQTEEAINKIPKKQ